MTVDSLASAAVSVTLEINELFDGLYDLDFDWFADPYMGLLGPISPVIIAVTILTMSYIYTGGIATPTVLSMLMGGSMIVWMPPSAQAVGVILVLGGIFLAIYSMYEGGGGRF